MINYSEKGSNLHDLIAKAGHSLSQIDGVWVASDDVAVQSIIDSYDPLSYEKEVAISKIYESVKSRIDQHSAGYSAAEIATFPALQSEIIEFNVSGLVGASMQDVIDRGRLTVQQLSDMLTPKITLQKALIAQRDVEVSLIQAETDWTLIDTASAIQRIEMI